MNLLSVYDLNISAYAQAVKTLYALLEERPAENRISHSVMPSFREHSAFVWSRPFRYWYMIHDDIDTPHGLKGPPYGTFVGCLECLPTNEFGVSVLRQFHRRGYATQAVKLFMEMHEPLPAVPAIRNGHWLANIAPGNLHSKEFFKKLGFHPIQETWQHG